jgi:hypothetical protein
MTHSRISEAVDHLVWFGDSWPAGVPGTKDHAFPALVGNNLGIESLNYSRPGSSIPELLIQFDQWKTQDYHKDKNYILIACLTNSNRFYWNDDYRWFTVGNYLHHDTSVEKFYKHSYNQEAVDFYNSCCIGHLKSLCNDLNISLYLVRNFESMYTDFKNNSLSDTGLVQFLLDDPDAIWRDDLKKQITKEKIGKGLFTDCAHPNACGHKKIADLLTDKLLLTTLKEKK